MKYIIVYALLVMDCSSIKLAWLLYFGVPKPYTIAGFSDICSGYYLSDMHHINTITPLLFHDSFYFIKNALPYMSLNYLL